MSAWQIIFMIASTSDVTVCTRICNYQVQLFGTSTDPKSGQIKTNNIQAV